MREAGIGLDQALREAQEEGLRRGRSDARRQRPRRAHKLVVWRCSPSAPRDPRESRSRASLGVEEIDHQLAERFGFTLKHLAIGREPRGQDRAPRPPGADPQEQRARQRLRRDERRPALGPARAARARLRPRRRRSPDGGERRLRHPRRPPIHRGGRRRPPDAWGIATTPRPLLPIAEVVARYYLRFTVGGIAPASWPAWPAPSRRPRQHRADRAGGPLRERSRPVSVVDDHATGRGRARYGEPLIASRSSHSRSRLFALLRIEDR